MPRNPSEQRLLDEFEIARAQHRQALLYVREMIEFSGWLLAVTPAAAKTAAFQTAFRRLDDAGEVYDMARLQLMDYLGSSGIQIRTLNPE